MTLHQMEAYENGIHIVEDEPGGPGDINSPFLVDGEDVMNYMYYMEYVPHLHVAI